MHMPKSKQDRIRAKWHILVEGDYVPPPIKTFKVLFSVVFDRFGHNKTDCNVCCQPDH